MNNIKYFDPEVLCETEWVANNLDNPEIKILEVDYDVENAYKSGHIQGAHMVWWKKDINDQTRRDIINKKQFESLMSRIGVSKSDTLILYGDFNNWFAAFAFWVASVATLAAPAVFSAAPATTLVDPEPRAYRKPNTPKAPAKIMPAHFRA